MQVEKNLSAPAYERYLSLSAKKPLKQYRQLKEQLGEHPGWAKLQQAFLDMIKQYLEVELQKPVTLNIKAHEAGGQFRIAFAHQMARGDARVYEYMQQIMEARKKYTDKKLYHGYVDCHEVHHEIENYIYFQNPLWYLSFPGKDTALESVLDVAHHVGNWEEGVPHWYDWKTHGFVSNWLGTKGVRDYPPFDYQEGNHFRFVDVVVLAYLATKEQRYLDLIEDYCDRWCAHIEEHAAKGEPIPCSILPEKAVSAELNHAGVTDGADQVYQIFYSLVSDNTMYDIAGCLLDVYGITGNKRYLAASEAMIDQFIQHSAYGRPSHGFSSGAWSKAHLGKYDNPDGKPLGKGHFVTECAYIARLALRHNLIAHSDKYKDTVLTWAKSVDEAENDCDQMTASILVAAHYFDGDPRWLERAYEMALRVAAVSEDQDEFHQCNWAGSRQGTKFLMEMLYTPITGDVEWGTRGNIPVRLFDHHTKDRVGIPENVYTRIWRKEPGCFLLEAVNLGEETASWNISMVGGEPLQITKDSQPVICPELAPGESARFELRFQPQIDVLKEYKR